MTGILVMKHKTFVGPTFYWTGSLAANRERIRDQAQEFINRIGADKIVSVAEHAMTIGPFSVVVWYRDEAAAPNQP
jgi:hypothetical protein